MQFYRGLRFVNFLLFCGLKNRSELQNLNFEPREGLLQRSSPVNGAPSSRNDLCPPDASDSRVFATKIIRFVWNIPSFLRDSKRKGLPHSFYCCLFFNRLLLLVVSISRSGKLKK